MKLFKIIFNINYYLFFFQTVKDNEKSQVIILQFHIENENELSEKENLVNPWEPLQNKYKMNFTLITFFVWHKSRADYR